LHRLLKLLYIKRFGLSRKCTIRTTTFACWSTNKLRRKNAQLQDELELRTKQSYY